MGGSANVVRTQGGGSPIGVLWVYKGGGWVKKGPKSMYVIYGRPLGIVLNRWVIVLSVPFHINASLHLTQACFFNIFLVVSCSRLLPYRWVLKPKSLSFFPKSLSFFLKILEFLQCSIFLCRRSTISKSLRFQLQCCLFSVQFWEFLSI